MVLGPRPLADGMDFAKVAVVDPLLLLGSGGVVVIILLLLLITIHQVRLVPVGPQCQRCQPEMPRLPSMPGRQPPQSRLEPCGILSSLVAASTAKAHWVHRIRSRR